MHPPTSFVTNHNHASGTFNTVSGDQQNYNFRGAIVLFGSRPATTQTVSTFIGQSDVSDRYRDVLSSIFAICELLHEFEAQPFSPGFLLQAIETELKEFARTVVYAAKALDIIDNIPGGLKNLRHLQDVSTVIRGYSGRLRDLHTDMATYRVEIHAKAPPGFWQGLWLYVFSFYRWERLASEIGLFLERNQLVLERFMSLLTSHHWRKIVSEPHGQQLEKLVQDAGLEPTTSLHHIQMLKILVRDHLGRLIPIPLEFCSSWNDLGIVVKHFCKDVQGSELIQRNDWELVHAANGAVVDPSRFKTIAKPESEFDISVVFRRLVSTLFTCPGCGYDNPRRQTADGWIDCYKCDKTFRITMTFPAANAVLPPPVAPARKDDHVSITEDTPLLHQRPAPTRFKPIRDLIRKNRHPPTNDRVPANVESEAGHPSVEHSEQSDSQDPQAPPDYEISNFHRVSLRVTRIVPRPPKRRVGSYYPTSRIFMSHIRTYICSILVPLPLWMFEQISPLRTRPRPQACVGFMDNLTPEILDGRIKVGRLIGRGGYALAYRGELQQNDSVVSISIKVFLAGEYADVPSIRRRVLREVRVIQGVSHPNLLRFHGLCTEPMENLEMSEDIPGLVSELCEGGSIMQFLERNPSTRRVPLVFQASLGLEYLHQNSIIHGDLKPDNIFITKDDDGVKAVLADFGRSRVENQRGFTTTIASSYLYTAPELVFNMGVISSAVPGHAVDPSRGSVVVTKSSDIYSFGLSTLTIVSNKPPFHTLSNFAPTVFLTIKNQRPEREDHASPEMSSDVWDLICGCWQVRPEDRPTVKTVADTLWDVLDADSSN